MVIVGLLLLLVAMAYAAASSADSGSPLRSRGSYRYQRRKARKLGLPPESVYVNTRYGASDLGKPIGRSHVSDLNRAIGRGLLCIVGGFTASFAAWSLFDTVEAFFPTLLLCVIGSWFLERHLKRQDALRAAAEEEEEEEVGEYDKVWDD